MRPFPPQGPSGRFPCFLGTTAALRLLAVHPASLRCPSLGGTVTAPSIRVRDALRCAPSPVSGASTWGRADLYPAMPLRGVLHARDAKVSHVPVQPHVHLPCSWTPAEPSRQAVRRSGVAPAQGTAKAPASTVLSRLDHTAFALAVYASRTASPTCTQDSLPLACQTFTGGLSTRRAVKKGFRSSHPPFTSLS